MSRVNGKGGRQVTVMKWNMGFLPTLDRPVLRRWPVRNRFNMRLVLLACCWSSSMLGQPKPNSEKFSAAEPTGLLIGIFGGTREIQSIELPAGRRKVVLRATGKDDFFPHASMSPDGSRLAYGYGFREVRVMAQTGTEEKQIVKAGKQDLDREPPLWSPDGTLLLVSGYAPAHMRDYVIDVAANRYWIWNLCELTDWPGPEFLRWTADGRGVWMRDRNLPSVFRCDFDGKVTNVWTTDKKTWELQGMKASLSPDEAGVLFGSKAVKKIPSIADPSDRYGYDVLSVDDLKNRSERQVFSAPHVGEFSWSPDGKWIVAFAQFIESPRYDDEGQDLFLKNVETGAVRRLGEEWDHVLQWWAPSPPSPVDSRAIVRAALGEGTPFSPPLEMPDLSSEERVRYRALVESRNKAARAGQK